MLIFLAGHQHEIPKKFLSRSSRYAGHVRYLRPEKRWIEYGYTMLLPVPCYLSRVFRTTSAAPVTAMMPTPVVRETAGVVVVA
jgi:hypothetical protein